jgi:N-acyl-D-aspartate/D-glutamate deacylase
MHDLLIEDARIGKRLGARARGIHATIVGGRVAYRDGRHTGALPGRVLRSGT